MSINVLHERASQDLHVRLIWNSATDQVYVKVRDRATGDQFLVAPDAADALDAFYHPFCYDAAPEVNGEPAPRASA